MQPERDPAPHHGEDALTVSAEATRPRSRRRLAGVTPAVRLVHPAPALTVVAVAAALGGILLIQERLPLDGRLALVVASVAASQVATGALNDWKDRERDARVRTDKPIPSGDARAATALVLGVAGLVVQLATSALLGPLPLVLGAIASASAQLYNFVLSRTPLSVVPYLVSFGVLPAWVAAGIGVPLERVVSASVLVVPFAAAAHLANALRDWELDAAARSRNLAQVVGRGPSRRLATGLALGVGVGTAGAFLIAERLQPASVALVVFGIFAVAQGATSERRLWYGLLVAAVAWTVAWALSTG